jgi:hypothetical protein
MQNKDRVLEIHSMIGCKTLQHPILTVVNQYENQTSRSPRSGAQTVLHPIMTPKQGKTRHDLMLNQQKAPSQSMI